ncbi:MAG: porin family protein, partial [Gemmatimonadota bacterium]|nr:porin family protein [Gemmatimonadota bacterium]
MTAPRRLFVAVMLATPLASAQGQVAERYVGLTGGATLSDVSGGGVNGSSRWGGTAGLIAGTVTFDYSFVEIGPSWMQAGGEGLRLDYIDVPILIGALVPIGGRDMMFRLYGGVGIGFKLGCKTPGTTTLACDLAKGTVWSLPVGLAFAKELSGGKFLGVDARYGAPLSDAFEVGG